MPVEAMVCLAEAEDVFLLMFSVGMMTHIFLFMVIHYRLPCFLGRAEFGFLAFKNCLG